MNLLSSTDQKAWNLLKKYQNRFPKFYEETLLKKTMLHTWISIDPSFLEKHPLKLLARLVRIQFYMRQKALKQQEDASSYNCQIKLFKTRTPTGSTLSIAIGINLAHEHEVLEEKHIFRALGCILTGIKIIPESVYFCREKKTHFLFCYLEIEKMRGTDISNNDIAILKKQLPKELEQVIQSLTYSLSYSDNEEEIYKSVVVLSKELKAIADLPQVIISFQSQTRDILRFNAVAVRVRKKQHSSIEQSINILPSSVQLAMQRIMPLMAMQKNYLKEALILSFEIDCSLFLKKNWSIDLRQARNYIVKIIEQIFGPFRDYYGGLISQQDKQLERIKSRLNKEHENFHPLLKELFYSFTPPLMQTLIPASAMGDLFSTLVSLIGKDVAHDGFVVRKKREKRVTWALFKTRSTELKAKLIEQIKEAQKEDRSSIAYGSLYFERDYYFYFVDLRPSHGRNIIDQFINSLKEGKIVRTRTKENKIFRMNFQEGDPPSLNPHIAIDQSGRCLGKALFEGLTRLDKDGTPEPAAAREIKISPCQTIYTFTLRELHWSNGEKVTAYDFERTWKKAIAPDSSCLRSDLFYVIKNARDVHNRLKPLNEVKIKAANNKTFIVELEFPAFYFLQLIALPIFSPLYRGEKEPNSFNGPFILKEWKRDKLIRLTSNPYYWDKKNVHLKGINISLIKDIHQICDLFINEELDYLGDPFSTLIPNLNIKIPKKQSWKKQKVDHMYWLYLNTQIFPLNSANIRKAIASAINRKEFVKFLEGATCTFSSLLKTPSNKRSKWDNNVPLAQAFFAEGLKELGISKEAFPKLTFLFGSITGEEKMLNLMQRQLYAALGIEIEILGMDWSRLTYLLDKREFQAATCFRSSPYLYKRSFLHLFREKNNLYNSSQWENAEYKKLIDNALQSSNQAEREKLFAKAEQIFIDHMPVIPIFNPKYQYVLAKGIKNFAIASNGDVDLKQISTSGQR